jgi:LCP family protein required for cell wall assembly
MQPVAPVQKFQTEVPKPVAPRRRVAPIDMSLPGGESPERFLALHKAKMRAFRRWMFRGTAVAMVLLITFGGLVFSQAYLKAHKVFKGTTGTAAALKSEVTPELLKGEGDGRVNILLLGRGGGTHDAPDLTDTMMIASIDPVNHTSTLISIPRDLWVQVPGGGSMKINGAWETGEFNYLHKVAPGSTDPKAIQAGFDKTDAVVESVLGIKISYNLIVNFQAFQQAVDTVGGVNVNVPTDLVDPTMAWENANNPILAKAGQQTFDGKHALIYVRSRETTSDFARSQRQRSVMLALKSKVVTLGTLSNPIKISGLMNAFGNNVSTDLSLSNASRLYSIIKAIPDNKTVSVGLGDAQNQLITTGNIGGQSVVLPKAGQFNFTDIQNYVRGQIQDPYIKKENAKVMVYNGTTVPGLASQQAATLKSYGYNVIGTSNTPTSGWAQTTLVDVTHKSKFTKNYLEKRLGVTAAASLQDPSIPTNGADFVIIVGSDEATTTQN